MILASMAVAAAIQSQGGALVFGGGDLSCARWLSTPAYEEVGRWWILGFWSGKNMEADDNSQVGISTDVEGIIGEVKLVCQAAPSKTIVMATLETYNRFKREGR